MAQLQNVFWDREERRGGGKEGSGGYEVYLGPPFGSSDPTGTQS
jgi:hypothetical protein